jgi:hypothetical protein
MCVWSNQASLLEIHQGLDPGPSSSMLLGWLACSCAPLALVVRSPPGSMIRFASACPDSELGVCSIPFLIHDTVALMPRIMLQTLQIGQPASSRVFSLNVLLLDLSMRLGYRNVCLVEPGVFIGDTSGSRPWSLQFDAFGLARMLVCSLGSCCSLSSCSCAPLALLVRSPPGSMILFASACSELELGVCSYLFLIRDTVVPVHDVSCKCLLAVPPV